MNYYSTVSQFESYYDSSEFYKLIFGLSSSNAYWLASRYAYCFTGFNEAAFGLRTVTGAFVEGFRNSDYRLFDSRNRTHSLGYPVRPIVTLGSDVRLQQLEGSSEWQIVRK